MEKNKVSQWDGTHNKLASIDADIPRMIVCVGGGGAHVCASVCVLVRACAYACVSGALHSNTSNITRSTQHASTQYSRTSIRARLHY